MEVIVDLRPQIGHTRDQGKRPTCAAFAASDAHSFARGSLDALSAEYAFFHAVKRTAAKDRNKGVSLKHVFEAISEDGQPLEAGWPYLISLSATDEWNPPQTIEAIFCCSSNRLAAVMASIYKGLDEGRPVILGMNIGVSFYHAGHNAIISAAVNEPRLNSHAVLAVGYGKKGRVRFVLIRNSWGKKWGDNGYAWIHEDYLKPRLLVAGVMVKTL
jgi:C1A family cysteine protease